jgi:hypothetical protein
MVAPNRVALYRPLRDQATATIPSVAGLTSVGGLQGWWDASTPGWLLGSTSTPGLDWNEPTTGLVNLSPGSAKCVCESTVSTAPPMRGAPRICGLLGGLGTVSAQPQKWSPTLDPDAGLRLDGLQFGSTTDWTCLLVWSRPNWCQGISDPSSPITLLSIVGGPPVLQLDGQGTTGRLILCPGPQQTVLKSTLSQRHTHSILLRFVAGRGIDAWLDDIRVATSATCALPATSIVSLTVLHSGSLHGSAQCWFHEAAWWQRSVTDSEIIQISTYLSRWKRGNRQGVSILVNGQSNAINYALNDGAAQLLLQGVTWYLGALAYSFVAAQGSPGAYTMISGHGLYPALGGSYPGDFVHNPGDGSDPSGWGLGVDGNAVAQIVGALSNDDRSSICAILWPWNETDSLRSYAEKSTFIAAAKRFLYLEREMLGDVTDRIPLIWWNAIPYGSTDGIQMHREVTAMLAADPTMNVVIGNPQTSDSNARGSAWDPVTGIATGGDTAHRDTADNQRFARSAAPIVARRLNLWGNADSIPTIPTGIPTNGGPRITHAYRLNDTTIIVSISHDTGTDLIVPLQAKNGVGFAVMDGGSVSAPGNVLRATSCTRIDPTHLSLVLEKPLTHPSTQCCLYYPYGSTVIGRGNCVTDNSASVPAPAHWDISSDLGPEWSFNFPLAATNVGIALSDQAR